MPRSDGRWSAWPGRTARARPRAGSSTPLARAGADPSAFVGALLPRIDHRRAARDGPLGPRSGRSSSRPTNTPATSTPTGRPSAVLTSAEWDHPGRLRRSGRRRGRLRGVDPRGRRRARPSWRTSATRASRPSSTASRDWPGPIIGYAMVDQAPQRLRRLRAGDRANGSRRATGRRPRCWAGSSSSDPESTDAGAPRARPARRAGHGPPADRRAATTRRTRWPWPAPPRSWLSRRDAIAAGLATFRGVGRRLERKGEAAGVVSTTTTATTRPRSARRWPPSASASPAGAVWAVYEPLTFHRTAAMLGGVRRCRWRRPMPWPSPTSGPAAIPTRRSRRQPGWRPRSRRAARASPSSRRDRSRPRRTRLAEAVRPGDVVLVMGGGASYRIGERLLERLEGRGMIDYAEAGELLEAIRQGLAGLRRRRLGGAVHRGRRVP